METSPFAPNRNPFIGITQVETSAVLKQIKKQDRKFKKRIEKLLKNSELLKIITVR
jgi:hypothetical protein